VVRTQISLDRKDYQRAKREAAALGISLAEFFRRAMKAALPSEKSKPWMRYAGLLESGDSQASSSIDDVVYGAKN
jgi:hypothetical protein